MKTKRSTVEIELNPYEDGSGHRHTVIARRVGEEVKVEIKQFDHCVDMSLEEWCEVRGSMDAAIKFAGGPDLGAGDLDRLAHVSIRNEE